MEPAGRHAGGQRPPRTTPQVAEFVRNARELAAVAIDLPTGVTSSRCLRRSVVVAVVALAMATIACSDDAGGDPTSSAAPATTGGVETTPTSADPVAIEEADEATQARVVSELATAFEAVQSQPVEISIEMVEEDEPRTATVRIDKPMGLLDATLIQFGPGGSAVTTRNVLVEGRAFLKSTTGPEAEAALDYTELPYASLGPDLLDEVFAGYGRIDKSLDRIVLLLESVPFAAQIVESEGRTEISVIMSPFAIYDFYGTSGLEAVGGSVPAEPTRLAFVVEAGVLRGLVADGTHFHDGEALEVAATITYTPIDPFSLEVPPIEG